METSRTEVQTLLNESEIRAMTLKNEAFHYIHQTLKREQPSGQSPEETPQPREEPSPSEGEDRQQTVASMSESGQSCRCCRYFVDH